MESISTKWTVYLSGEIHSDWREQIVSGTETRKLSARFLAPQCNHEMSDDCGDILLGRESHSFWKDHKSARINSIRSKKMIQDSDIVVVRFGPKYKQWTAAFDAGFAAALGKSLITLHEEEVDHAMKEINAAALATARTPAQIVDILEYVMEGKLPR